MENLKHILIFEAETAGHQSDYLRILISYFLERNLCLKLTFLVSSKLFERLILAEELSEKIKQGEIEILTLTEFEIAKCTNGLLYFRALYCWRTAFRYCKRYKADHVHFLFLDHMQLPLALRLPLPKGVTISGILFKPSIHYEKLWTISLSLKEKLRDVRKELFYRFMLRHPAVRLVFSLDEYFTMYAKKCLPYGHKVHYLPDPSFFPTDDDGKSVFLDGLVHRIHTKRKIFLMFGTLDKRKGVFEILKALSMLENEVIKRTAFFFAGKLRDEIRDEFMSVFHNYLKSHPEATADLDDRFISNGDIVYLLKGCDVVLMPYQRHIGSSGLLIWAASAKKPVITQDFGLMGALTRKYKLGKAIDTTKPLEIARTITQFVSQNRQEAVADDDRVATFVSKRSPEAFSEKFFEDILQAVQTRVRNPDQSYI